MKIVILLIKLSFAWTAVTPQNEDSRPIVDRILQPVLGRVGTIKFVEEQVNAIGGSINQGIDLIHDTDHGTRMCNIKDPINQGVCFGISKCGALGGRQVGTCSIITPKNSCCKFERTCGGISSETITYFQNNADNLGTDPCVFVTGSRLGTCQIRIDLIDFMFPPPDPDTGMCDPNNSLEILSPPDHVNGKRKSLFFCGVNSGNHIYIPITRKDQKVYFKVRNRDREVKDWNIRVTQVDCRSGLESMRLIRAPEGCFQYFYQRFGPMASFNFDSVSPLMSDQDYSICFQSNSTFCALAFQSLIFQVPEEESCSNSYFAVNDPRSPNQMSLNREKFCGGNFGDEDHVAVTFQKPFVVRVKVGSQVKTQSTATGFLMAYELIENC